MTTVTIQAPDRLPNPNNPQSLGIKDAKVFVEKLEEIRKSGPQEFEVTSEFDQRAVANLTGGPRPHMYATSDEGFTTEDDRRRRRAQWGTGAPDTDVSPPNGDAPSHPRSPQPTPSSGGGSSAAAVPSSTQPSASAHHLIDAGATVLLESPEFDPSVDIRNLQTKRCKLSKQATRKKGRKRSRSKPRLPSGHRDRR